MLQFTLNGQNVTVEADKNLLEYLRADARMTSVKDGCAEGVCGTCSVIVNGKAVRACALTVAKVQGKSVTTSEGLSPRERDVYAWAFGEVGAVQCGFCMPGMLISAKALLDAVRLAPARWKDRRPLKKETLRRIALIRRGAFRPNGAPARNAAGFPGCPVVGLVEQGQPS